jgi:hypothetical protein
MHRKSIRVVNISRRLKSFAIHTYYRNTARHSKEVTTNALTLVSFAVGNILGTQTFQQKQAPGYTLGKISIIATLSAVFDCCFDAAVQ